MPKKLGYGGIANTNGARDFSGKTEAEVPEVTDQRQKGQIIITYLKHGRTVIRI